MSSHRRDLGTIGVALSHAFSRVEYEERDRTPKLRSSSLPYCPLREWYYLVTDPKTYMPELREGRLITRRDMDLDSLLYTSMGHTIHEALQNWIPKSAQKIRVLAKWDPIGCELKGKGCPYGGSNLQEMTAKGCSKCGKHPIHNEVEFNAVSTGHIDCIWIIGVGMDAWIIDIKTTSLQKVWAHMSSVSWDPEKEAKKKGKKRAARPKSPYPDPTYVHQVDAYALRTIKMLKNMGYRLKGTALLMVPRDRPNARVIVPIRMGFKKAWLKSETYRLDQVARGWQRLTKRMKEQDLGLEAGLEAEKHRLCDTQAYYEESVEPCWECPLADACFSDKERRAVIKRTAKVYDNGTALLPAKSSIETAGHDYARQLRKFEGGIKL